MPNWVGFILSLLLLEAAATWILAPLLNVIPAYVLFGLLFVVGVVLLWWKAGLPKRSPLTLFLVSGIWASVTCLLYYLTLQVKHDDTSLWWFIAAAGFFALTILVAWLVSKNRTSKDLVNK